MDFKRFSSKIKAAWKNGVIQRTSRITYDVVWNIILFFIVVGLIAVVFAGGVGAGYFASLVKDEPIRGYEEMKKEIYNYEETSKLYFANKKYIGDVRSDLHREEISLDKVSDTLIDAVIATEDQFFYEHEGVVPKAIVRAVFQEATNSDTKSGGSTLTQQLIKNQILTNEVSFERKAKEIVLALRLENFFEKEEILEAYLNVIPYGREASGANIAGIQTAAKGIFGVKAKDLNLPQSAYLAGLPQNPYVYTPFVNTGGLKDEENLQPGIDRMKSVLKRMYEAEFITEKEYKKALKYDITKDFTTKKKTPLEKYPFLVQEIEMRAEEILMEKLAEEEGYSLDDLENSEELKEQFQILAKRDLQMGGYRIHSTIDKDLYDKFQEVAQNYQYYGPDQVVQKKDLETGKMVDVVEPIETGAVLIENKTGKILSFVGGRNFNLDNQFNYATKAKRSPGSTIKPLIVYAPAMEKGVIQPGSVIADIPQSSGWPKNYGGGTYGLVSARKALASSYNISAVQVYDKILSENPADEYLEKMGVTTLTEGDKTYRSLALGGMDDGMTVEENTNAFTTFSNNGQFIDAYMIDKITTKDGEVIYEHKVEPVDVFSPQTAYLTIDMMRDVIRAGTATYLQSQLKYGGVDWAGKTGTSNDYKDAWFIGTNPNVTLGTWIGYETPNSIWCNNCALSYSQRNMKLWAELINSAGDLQPELVATKERFKQPEGIVHRSYCATSGLLPSKLCQQAGLVRSDIYNAKHVPSKVDDSLIAAGKGGALVVVNGKEVLAGPNTPKEFTKGRAGGLAFNPEFLKRNGYDKLSDLSVLYPRDNPEAWSRIGFAKGVSFQGGAISDDGKSPSPPGSIGRSGSQLTWSASGSHDVVGYRIFKGKSANGSFKLVGHTINTSYPIGNGAGVYFVKAVDYFGLESSPSEGIVVDGNVVDSGSNKEDKKKDNKNKEDKKKDTKNKTEKKDKQETEVKKKPKENENKKEKEKREPEKKEKPKEEKEQTESEPKDKDKNNDNNTNEPVQDDESSDDD